VTRIVSLLPLYSLGRNQEKPEIGDLHGRLEKNECFGEADRKMGKYSHRNMTGIDG